MCFKIVVTICILSVPHVSLVTGLVVMIIGNNIVATPLAITMAAVTMVTTVMEEAVDRLIGGTEVTSDSKP